MKTNRHLPLIEKIEPKMIGILTINERESKLEETTGLDDSETKINQILDILESNGLVRTK